MRTRTREQRVLAPPPTIFFGGLVAGVILDMYAPLTPPSSLASLGVIGVDAPLGRRLASASVLFVAGFALNFWAVLEFRRKGTTVLPWGQPSRLVLTGPYRFTRNPMYLGLAVAYVALGIVVGSIWALLLLPAVLGVVANGVIRREESYLSWRFGSEYGAYEKRVRRWL